MSLLPESLEAVRELRAAFSLVCEFADEWSERFQVAPNLQTARADRIETNVAERRG